MKESKKTEKQKEEENKKTILLNDIDIIEFLGVNNINFSKITSYFPKLKLIARDSEIKAIGDKQELNKFTKSINLILDYYHKFNSINSETIDELLSADDTEQKIIPPDVILFGNKGKVIRSRTDNQHLLVEAFKKDDLIFAVGPAGTGKTYIAIALAVSALKNKEVKKIILTRPAVEAGEQLGFLPGDLKDKLDPYLQPLYDALNDMIPHKKLASLFEEKTIEIAPLAYMRGRTLNDACVILDEAQNATENQIKMFLTRMGKTSKFIVTGDLMQIDLPKKEYSGLFSSIKKLADIKGISQIVFTEKDVVRHKLVKDIIKAYK